MSKTPQIAQTKKDIKIKNMQIPDMKIWLRSWKVKFIINDEVIKEKFYDAIQTLFALSSMHDATDEMVGETKFNDLISSDVFPGWVKELQERGVTEPDIREIILRIGSEPRTMMLASDVAIRKLAAASPAKRLLEFMVKQWAKPENGMKIVNPGANLRDILVSEQTDEVFQSP